MRVIGVIQARMGSTRLPGKSLMMLADRPLLAQVIERTKKAHMLDVVVLATSKQEENDPLVKLALSLGIEIIRGSENDVLSRFIEAGRRFNADNIVRICADNPFIDPDEIDRVVTHHLKTDADLSFNNVPYQGTNYPDGLGAEVVRASLLYEIDALTRDPKDREHVTQYILDRPHEFRIEFPRAPLQISGPDVKLDIDTQEDFDRMLTLIESLPTMNAPFWCGKEILLQYRRIFHAPLVLILDDEASAKTAITAFGECGGEVRYVSANPAASWTLEKGGISFTLIEAFYDNNALYTRGLSRYLFVEEICNQIDEYLMDRNKILKQYGLLPARDNFVSLKIAFDILELRADMLTGVIRELHPSFVLVRTSPTPPVPDLRLNCIPVGLEESIFAHLLHLPGWPCLTGEFDTSTSEERDSKISIFKPSTIKKYLIGYVPTVFIHLGPWRSFLLLPQVILNQLKRGPVLFMQRFAYSWDYMIDTVVREGYRIVDLDRLTALHEETNSDFSLPPKFQEWLSSAWMGAYPDLSGLYLSRITPFIEQSYRDSGIITESVSNAILRNTPGHAFICGPKINFFEHLPAKICSHYGIPIISWQHGGAGHHLAPIILYHGMMTSDYYLVFGEGTYEALQSDPLNKFPCHSIAIGSVELEELFFSSEMMKTPRFEILYVTSSYYMNYLYVSFPETLKDNEFWQSQKIILSYLGNSLKECAVKLHPGLIYDDNIIDFVETRGFNNLALFKQSPTTLDLFADSGIVVLDLPTTTLLQSIAAKKIIFVLLKHMRLTPEAKALLQRRAYCADEPDELMQLLDAYLKNIQTVQKPDVNDIAFLERYGICKADGMVKERALAVLKGATSPMGKRIQIQ